MVQSVRGGRPIVEAMHAQEFEAIQQGAARRVSDAWLAQPSRHLLFLAVAEA